MAKLSLFSCFEPRFVPFGLLGSAGGDPGPPEGGGEPPRAGKKFPQPVFTPPALCADRFGPFSAVLGLFRGGAPQPLCRYSLFLLAFGSNSNSKKWALAYRAAVHKWYGTNRGRAGGVNEEAGVGI